MAVVIYAADRKFRADSDLIQHWLATSGLAGDVLRSVSVVDGYRFFGDTDSLRERAAMTHRHMDFEVFQRTGVPC